MSIALSCEKCGKQYEMPDSVAGKRARCKQCGHEFRIPVPASVARARTTAPDTDPYGLKETAARPKPKSYTEEDELPPPPRMPYKPERSKSRSRSRDEIDGAVLRRGLWCMFFGVGIFVLPFFGVQFRWVSFLPEIVQLGIGVAFMAFGSFSLVQSGANAIFGGAGFVATALGAIIAVGAMVVENQGAAPNQGGPPQVAQGGQPPIPGPPPLPGAIPAPTLPNGANPNAGLTSGRAVLSNARMTRDGLGGGHGLSLSVDYRFENGGPQIGQRYCLMLESPGSKSRVTILRIESQGTISANLMSIGPAQDTSYVVYLAIETHGPGGRGASPISDKVNITVTQNAQTGAFPPGMQPGMQPGIQPGMQPGQQPGMQPGMQPGPPRRGRMPRPGFGPR